MLDAKDISVHFGGVTALDDVSLALEGKEILGLIGPNGAGKTTLVNVLSGFQKPARGSIWLEKQEITGLSPRQLARMRIGRTFQAGRLFRELTVLENIAVSAVGIGRRLGSAGKEAITLLKRLNLLEYTDNKAGKLPFGLQRRVGIARALALKPRYLLLDEPAAGLNENECEELMGDIISLPEDFGCAVLLIDHNIQVIMETCKRIHVLDGGQTLSVGTPEEIKKNESVISAYFGSGQI